jgi:cation:H+ antiporter
MVYLYIIALIFSFAVLFKAADYFVAGAVGIADIFKIPKLIVGIVLVGLATTAPEFAVSIIAAILGNLEISLGNAIGSVICDDGVALALAAVLAPVPILINCRILKITGMFLLSIDILAYLLLRNGVIGRAEGLLFVLILVVYFVFILKNPRYRVELIQEGKGGRLGGDRSQSEKDELRKSLLLMLGGISGVIAASFVVNWAAVSLAVHFSISQTVIGSTIVAIGTSLPEIGTCVAAALRGEGEIAVGNILGADVLNILWIIGVASIIRPLQVGTEVIHFTFPFMIFVVLVMLISMRIRCRLGKIKGVILFSLYLIYLVFMMTLFT